MKDPKTQETASRFVSAPMPWAEKMFRALAADLPQEKKGQALFQLAQCLKSKATISAMLRSQGGGPTKIMEIPLGKDCVAELRSANVAKLEAEAIQLFTEVAQTHGNERHGSRKLLDYATGAIYELQNLASGKTAPEIGGMDIDDKPMKLSDYKGKVVLLTFWGHW